MSIIAIFVAKYVYHFFISLLGGNFYRLLFRRIPFIQSWENIKLLVAFYGLIFFLFFPLTFFCGTFYSIIITGIFIYNSSFAIRCLIWVAVNIFGCKLESLPSIREINRYNQVKVPTYSSPGILTDNAKKQIANPFEIEQKEEKDLLSIMSKLKIMNSFDLVLDFIYSTCIQDSISALFRFSELHGFFWTTIETKINQIQTLKLSIYNIYLFLTDQSLQELYLSEIGTQNQQSIKKTQIQNLPNFHEYAGMYKKKGNQVIVALESEDSLVATIRDTFGITDPKFTVIGASMLAFVTVLITFVFGKEFFSSSKKDKTLTTIVNEIGTFSKNCTSSAALFSTFGLTIFNAGLALLGAQWIPKNDSEMDSFIKEINTATDKIDKYLMDAKVIPTIFFSNPNLMEDCEKAFNDCSKLHRKMLKHKQLKNAKPLFDRMQEQFKELKSHRDLVMNSSNGKQEPTVIWIAGPHMQGKSQVVNTIVDKLSELHQRKLTTYTRSFDKYWTGYCFQDVVIYDEFMKTHGVDGRPDAMELQEFFTCNSTALNLAAVEEKGRKFASKYIIICSNLLDPIQQHNLVSITALFRRRDILLICGNSEFDKFVNDFGYTPTYSNLAYLQDTTGIDYGARIYPPDCSTINLTSIAPEVESRNQYNHLHNLQVTVDEVAKEAFRHQCKKAKIYHDTLCKNFGQEFEYKQEGTKIDMNKLYFKSRHPSPLLQSQSMRTWLEEMHDLVNKVKAGAENDKAKQREILQAKPIVQQPFVIYNNSIMVCSDNSDSSSISSDESYQNLILDRQLENVKTNQAIIKGGHNILNVWIKDQDQEDFLNDLEYHLKKGFNYTVTYDLATPGNFLIIDDNSSKVFIPRLKNGEFKDQFKCILNCKNYNAPLATVPENDFYYHDKKFFIGPLATEGYSMTKHIVYRFKLQGIDFDAMKQTLYTLPPKNIKSKIFINLPNKDILKLLHQGDFSFLRTHSSTEGIGYLALDGIFSIFNPYITNLRFQRNSIEQQLALFNELAITYTGESLLFSTQNGNFLLTSYHRLAFFAKVDVDCCEENELINDLDLTGMDPTAFMESVQELKKEMYILRGWNMLTPEWKERLEMFQSLLLLLGSFLVLSHSFSCARAKYHDWKCKEHQKEKSKENADRQKKQKEKPKSTSRDLTLELFEENDAFRQKTRKDKNVKKNLDLEFSEENDGFRQKTRKDKGQKKTLDLENDGRAVNYRKKTTPKKDLSLETVELSAMKEDFHRPDDMRFEEALHGSLLEKIPESFSNVNSQIASEVVRDNIVDIRDEDDGFVCSAVMLEDVLGVTVLHAKKMEDLERDLWVCYNISGRIFTSPLVEVARDTKRDLLFFQIEKSKRQFRNITHLIPSNVPEQPKIEQDALLIRKQRYTHEQCETKIFDILAMKVTEFVPTSDDPDCGFQYRALLNGQLQALLPIATKPGDCGSPLIAVNSDSIKPLIGIHKRASAIAASCAVFCMEDILTCRRKLNKTNPQALKPQKGCNVQFLDYDPKDIQNFGAAVVAKFDQKTHLPIKTQYHRSILHPPWHEHTFAPTILSDLDPRLTDDDGIPKCEIIRPEIFKWKRVFDYGNMDKDLMKKTIEDVTERIVDVAKASGKKTRVLTKSEALNGCSLYEVSNPIDKHSSVGIPLKNLFTQSRGKYHYLKFNEQKQFWSIDMEKECGKVLNNLCDQLIDTYRRGDNPVLIYEVCPKDEVRKLKKIYDTPQTRIFTPGPFQHSITYRMYFHAAVALVRECRLKLPMKVGMNPFGDEVDYMVRKAISKGTNCFDGDFSHYDASHPLFLVRSAMNVFHRVAVETTERDPRLTPELFAKQLEDERIIREGIMRADLQPFISIDGHLVQFSGGVFSGQPATTDLNGILNFMYIYYAWLNIMKDQPELQNMAAFLHHCEFLCFGDDNILFTSDKILKKFNLQTVHDVLEKHLDVILLGSSKDKNNIEKFHHFTEAEFLKRKFVLKGDKFTMPLVDESIVKMLEWTTGPKHIYATRKLIRPPKQNKIIQIPNIQLQSDYLLEQDLQRLRDWVDDQQGGFKREGSRKVMYFGSEPYEYNGGQHQPKRIPKIFRDLFHFDFNGVLINYYPDTSSGIPWHRDNEELEEGIKIFTLTQSHLCTLQYKYENRMYEIPTQENQLIHDFSETLNTCFHRTLSKGLRISISFRNHIPYTWEEHLDDTPHIDYPVLVQTAQTCLVELVLHGREKYNKYREWFKQVLPQNTTELLTYEDQLKQINVNWRPHF
ncbi:hypothetical protein 1 [Hubei myriapoda virus 3]|uniref:hypothetical protein 1 n=1 Tax=Hubei myriapoda virus 3 TaxID=1922932 RepID=UPI00090B91B9|nr:hypothetical protein 1 [Hubei myriapoda virus 3]APG77509.1 hypothetical protein 1 [Hubei myriapoda virus 3]